MANSVSTTTQNHLIYSLIQNLPPSQSINHINRIVEHEIEVTALARVEEVKRENVEIILDRCKKTGASVTFHRDGTYNIEYHPNAVANAISEVGSSLVSSIARAVNAITSRVN
jgi:hypothetical protein